MDRVLADLKRQREDLDCRIAALEAGQIGTADILDSLQKWRARAEKSKAIADDETLRLRK